MFSNNPFYHGIIRKGVVAFGEVFNDLMIETRDENGNIAKRVKVPISYAMKEKWFVRLAEDPEFKQHFQILLPRMSFEITSMYYDASRKIGTRGDYLNSSCVGASKIFTPVPWTIGFSLWTYTKTQEDSLQIVEQILPFFSPSLTVSFEVLDGIRQDVPITLNSVERNDSYDGSLENARLIIQEFKFDMKLNLFGPTNSNIAVIKQAIVDINKASNINADPFMQYDVQVVPRTAERNDVFTLDEKWNV